MKLLLVGLFLASPFAHAALNMKPGLWSVKMNMNSEGKTINPQEKFSKSMAQMTQAEKDRMKAMMARMNAANAESGNTNICYSRQAIDHLQTLGQSANASCETKVVKDTSSVVETTFRCEDGSSGEATWNLSDTEHMMGQVNVIDTNGKKSTINYNGKFLNADCGKIKAVL